ncbi:MAG TPA: hypothetical protein VME63_09385 [Dyella sp.]|uniref:hypothetical protein n=1 Tax=Dyella sp. TaxID=1869338 RepID=UPI002CADE99F|nr:hypothetical protein [Dyella sp.]HTV85609.1 hypothetical protein [Dyella sp.]
MTRFVPLAVLLSAGIAATTGAAAQSSHSSASPAAAAPAPATRAQARPSPIKPGDHNCILDTGSAIAPRPGHCLPVIGRSYSKDDIDNTGERTLGPALERLDPSITVHGAGY